MVLSVLCGGLWAAINWFARELAGSKELEAVRRREADGPRRDDSDTETEEPPAGEAAAKAPVGRSTTLQAGQEPSKRRSLAESGTDSEWDKVDDVSAEE